jgi:cytochrome c oxidase assembly protein subunit 11
LVPGQTVDMGISFFVDPEIVNDRYLDDVTEITLSYTFFEVLRENADLGALGLRFPILVEAIRR